METNGNSVRLWRVLGLVMAAVLVAAVSSLPAGIGNLGRTTDVCATGSTVDTTFNPTITATADPNHTTAASLRDSIVAQINDPNGPYTASFIASAITDSSDPSSNSFSITQRSGSDLDHLRLCENDPNIDNAGVSFPSGRDAAVLNKPTAINANGDYTLSISVLDVSTFSATFNTADPNNDTAAELVGHIKSTFAGFGFSIVEDATNLTFRKPGDKITALRVSSTDTGVVIFCVDVTSNSLLPTGIPTVSEVGAFLLVVLMTLSAIWMLRRRPMPRRT